MTDVLEFLAVFILIIVLGGYGVFMYRKMRSLQDRVSGGAQQDAERLTDAVDNLRSEVGLLSDEVREISERMDFTERLLERPKTEE